MRLPLIAGVVVLALFSTACGSQDVSSDNTATGSETTTSAPALIDPTSTSTTAAAGPLTTRPDPRTEIAAEGWGRRGDRLIGPGGLDLDLSNCPADPPSSGPIIIGTNAAEHLLDAHVEGIRATFEEANEQGGISGRPIELVVAIDRNGHWLNLAAMVDDLVTSHHPHALIPAGSSATEVEDAATLIDSACTPSLFWIGTGPSPSPWITYGLTDVRSELATIGRWLESESISHVLVITPTLADWVDRDARSSLAAGPKADYVEAEVTGEFSTDPARAYEAVVIVNSSIGCQSAATAAKAIYPDAEVVTLGTWCPAWSFDGEIGLTHPDGVIQLFATDPTDAERHLDRASAVEEQGRLTAGLVVEALRLAVELDGGLTRSNILLASLLVDAEPDWALPGIQLRTRGHNDRYLLESGIAYRWDTANRSWVLHRSNTPVDADGATPSFERNQPEPITGPDPCDIAGLDQGLLTDHWFPVDPGGSRVDAQADIILHVPGDEGPVTKARLRAETDDGDEVLLDLVPGQGPTCGDDQFFDVPLGNAKALRDLGESFSVRFEFDDGAWATEIVRWPDDFERDIPFGPTKLQRAPS